MWIGPGWAGFSCPERRAETKSPDRYGLSINLPGDLQDGSHHNPVFIIGIGVVFLPVNDVFLVEQPRCHRDVNTFV